MLEMKRVANLVMAMVIATGVLVATPNTSEAANYHVLQVSQLETEEDDASIKEKADKVNKISIKEKLDKNNKEKADKVNKKSKKSKKEKKVEKAEGIMQYGSTFLDEVWAKKANSNIVRKLRNPSANVVTLDGIDKLVSQYGIDGREDFVDFVMEYTNDYMFIIVDSKKAQRGFQYALNSLQNRMNAENVPWDLELRNVTNEDFEEDELQVLNEYVNGDRFFAVQIIRTYRRRDEKGGYVTNPQLVVSNGTSKFTDTLTGINQVLSIPTMLDGAKTSIERIRKWF